MEVHFSLVFVSACLVVLCERLFADDRRSVTGIPPSPFLCVWLSIFAGKDVNRLFGLSRLPGIPTSALSLRKDKIEFCV